VVFSRTLVGMTVSDRLRSVLPGFDDPSSGDAVEPPDGAPWWRGAIVGVLTGLTSLVVVRADSELRTVADLRGKRIGVGAADSPQATLIPLLHVAEAGVEPGVDCMVQRFDVLLGKHGDHVGGERDAARALVQGEVDAACMIDGNHLVFAREGTLPTNATRILSRTGAYDHCNFTVLDGAPAVLVARFRELLLSMSYDDASARPLMDLEGLKAWLPGRTSGYAQLERACERFDWLAPFLARMGAA